MSRIVKCPTCGADVEYGPRSPFRPFCSERCKLIDLGAWATDAYRIPGRYDQDRDDLSSEDVSPESGAPARGSPRR